MNGSDQGHQAELGKMRCGHDGDGGLGDRLVEAVLRGEKTATSSLLRDYEENEPLPRAGERLVLVDSSGRSRGVVETVEVRTVALRDIDLSIALAEGEGFESVADWEQAHRAFWASTPSSGAERSSQESLSDTELVVVEFFHLVETGRGSAGNGP